MLENVLTTQNKLYIIYFVTLFIISILGYRLLFKHTGFLKKKNETGERFASQSKPIIGGTMFFVSIVLGFIFTTIYGLYIGNTPNYTLLICCVLAFGMGCVDDLKNFSPLFKLVFQIICAFLLIATNNHIETSDNIFLNYLLTVFWVVGLMNSINMLDNMDGITASTSLIIFAGLAGIATGLDTAIILSIIACLIAFLIWNWHPAKMYMGDNGSQLLGILLAYFSIKYVWNSGQTYLGFNHEQILFVGLMFLIPLTDTTTVAINRFLAGHSPFVGDRYHTTHCLVYKGLSIPKTVLLLDTITIIGTVSSWFFITQKNALISHEMSIVYILFCIIVFLSAYIMNLLIRKENNLLYKHD